MTTTSHTVLPGTERRVLPGSKLIGVADPTHRIEVTIKLRRKAPLPPLTERPKEPLTRANAIAQYGASDEDIAKVTDVLKGYGFDVVHSDKATRSVVVAGPIRAMEQAFEVKLFRYAHDQGTYRGRSGMLQVPGELNGIVVGVFGLDNRPVIRRRRPGAGLASPPGVAFHAAIANKGFLPADLARLYSFPDGDGAGQTIGILEFGGRIQTDAFHVFCQRIGIASPPVVEVDVDGGAQDTGDDPSGEVMLDIEVVAGICPKASIPVYFGPTFDERSWVDTIDHAIHDTVHNPTILSISWGNSEDGPQSAWQGISITHVNDALHEAALLGVTVCVAAGDDGSDDQGGDGKAHADFPSSSPFALAVGGTDLRVRNGTATERVWKDGDGLRADGGGSGGGGVSALFPRPQFQQNIAIKSVNPGAILGRVVPDVAAHAQSDGRRTGYFFVADGPSGTVVGVNGGTSASAPLWAALIARINAILQREKGPGKRAGYLTPVFYQVGTDGQPLGASVCKDITDGDNISAAIGGYQAGPGYDAASGWGSPIGTKLLDALREIV
jgi:kumamolisin